MRVFKTFEVCDILEVEESVMASWLKLMETHYHRQNAYHNSTHAADVLQATAYFIKILQDYLVSQGVTDDFYKYYSILYKLQKSIKVMWSDHHSSSYDHLKMLSQLELCPSEKGSKLWCHVLVTHKLCSLWKCTAIYVHVLADVLCYWQCKAFPILAIVVAKQYWSDIIESPPPQEMLERLEIAALLITAVIHDLDHPGRTNPHLCNTRHHLAILYNDRYVRACTICITSLCNLFSCAEYVMFSVIMCRSIGV